MLLSSLPPREFRLETFSLTNTGITIQVSENSLHRANITIDLPELAALANALGMAVAALKQSRAGMMPATGTEQ